MAKQLNYGMQARRAMQRGIDALADAVKVTLGPRGRNVAIDRGFGSPLSTKDGVTVAEEIDLPDSFENMGAQLVREVAEKTGDQAGDGTTTATVLAQAIFREGLKNVTAGAPPIALKRGIDRAVEAVVEELHKMARPVQGKTEITQVAAIASNSDGEVGRILAEAMEKVGKDGVITVEEAKGIETSLEVVEGMQFDQGYVSAYFVTDPQRMEAMLEGAYVLIHEKKISNLKELLPLLQQTAQTGAALLIVSEEVEGDALAALVVNKLKGVLRVAAVKAPGFGDRRKEMLEDIAVLTGARAFSEELGMKLENAGVEHLGRVKQAKIGKDKTVLIEGAGKKKEIADRIAQIKKQIEKAASDYDKEKLQERLAKLSGGVAIVRVGAPTELELKEKKARVEDALHATRAAVEEGIVPGGGVALLRARRALDRIRAGGDEKLGVEILRAALEIPARAIAENAGREGAVVVKQILDARENEGYNAQTDKIEDLVKAGVIDPKKVTRTALQNAASIAGLMLTTEALVADFPEKQPAMPAGMPHPGMGGMGGMPGMDMGGDF